MGAGRRGDRPYGVPLGFFGYAKLNKRLPCSDVKKVAAREPKLLQQRLIY
jgi:hypothetical protein